VKICGITRGADARLAVELGADAIGFVFWSGSPRAISAPDARAVARDLPKHVIRAGVFVDASPDFVIGTVGASSITAAQLHGDEDVGRFASCGVPLIKAVTLASDEDVERAAKLPASVTVLVDAHAPIARGGTGRQADWSRAARLASRRPIVLAGGLNQDNVSEAITAVRPWAIDVSSGVEDAPGIKNALKLRAFFDAVLTSPAAGRGGPSR
jgi:phosphoribosylanthranilate isomerase